MLIAIDIQTSWNYNQFHSWFIINDRNLFREIYLFHIITVLWLKKEEKDTDQFANVSVSRRSVPIIGNSAVRHSIFTIMDLCKQWVQVEMYVFREKSHGKTNELKEQQIWQDCKKFLTQINTCFKYVV